MQKRQRQADAVSNDLATIIAATSDARGDGRAAILSTGGNGHIEKIIGPLCVAGQINDIITRSKAP